MSAAPYETVYSSTGTTITTTEWSLPNNATFSAGVSNPSRFWIKFALPAAAVAADEFTFKIYNMIDGTNLDATYSIVVKGNGARQNIEIKDPVTASTIWDATLKSTAGTARVIPWIITAQQAVTATADPATASNAEVAASNAALLASRLTSARAGYLDSIPQAASNASNTWVQIQIDASNILANASNIGTLLTRLTATRAGYLDSIPQAASNASNTWVQIQVDASNILANASNINTLLTRLTAVRAGYLDSIPQAASNASNTWVQIQVDASNLVVLVNRLTALRAGYLDSIPQAASNASNSLVLLTTMAADAASNVLNSLIDSTYTLKKYIEAIGAGAAGKSSGVAAGSPKYRNLADNVEVISGTASAGDRTAASYTFT